MELNLLEKFIILAKHTSKARFQITGIHLGYGIAGAALLEMSKDSAVEIKDKKIYIRPDKSFENPLLNEIAGRIKSNPGKDKLRYWMNQMYRKANRYKWQLIEGLAEKGLFRIEEKKFLGLISYRNCYLTDLRIHQSLVAELRSKVNGNLKPGTDDLLLLGIVEACQMQGILVADRKERKHLNKQLKQLLQGNIITDTVDIQIRQVQAAILATMVASTVATTAAR